MDFCLLSSTDSISWLGCQTFIHPSSHTSNVIAPGKPFHLPRGETRAFGPTAFNNCLFSLSIPVFPSTKLWTFRVTSYVDHYSATAAKSLQLYPTLCDPIDGSPPGSPVPRILQARTLEWVAISFSNAWKWNVKVKSLSRVRLLATPWTAAYQAPSSMGFSSQEYWSGVPLPSPDHSSIPTFYQSAWASLAAQSENNLPAVRETWVWSLGWEDPLEKRKVIPSSILARRIPWTVESMGSPRVRHNWATFTFLVFNRTQ